MTETVFYETDAALREHLCTDDELTMAELCYPGAIRLRSSGRYHAQVEVYSCSYQFRIRELQHGERELISDLTNTESTLRKLAWHKAAEAILAHRRGHFDAQQRKSLRKPKTEQDV